MSLQPERAKLVGQQADVVRTLLDGHHSRLAHIDTPDARRKRRQRTENGTLGCFRRGERRQAFTIQVKVRVESRAVQLAAEAQSAQAG
jgi:hypothetical protein